MSQVPHIISYHLDNYTLPTISLLKRRLDFERGLHYSAAFIVFLMNFLHMCAYVCVGSFVNGDRFYQCDWCLRLSF